MATSCCLILLKIFLICIATSAIKAQQDLVNNENITLQTFWFDEELLKDLSHQMVSLKLSNENVRLKVDNYNVRLEHELNDLKKSLDSKTEHIISSLQNIQFQMAVQPNLLAPQPNSFSIDPRIDVPPEPICKKCPEPTQVLTPQLPSSCMEALQNNNQSGIHKLFVPGSGLAPFDIYCLQDPEGGEAWSIIQRRQDGSTDFYRGWEEYKKGFGNISGEYFIGMEKLHALTTKAQLQELWVQLEDYDSEKRFAKYKYFAIGHEDEKYALNLLGNYTGNAGDSFVTHVGQEFSTKDKDNDNNAKNNCAEYYTGAWWYNTCYRSNLNGAYGKDKAGKGPSWNEWRKEYSLKYVHMAIRPVK